MKQADVRAHLEAVANGKKPPAAHSRGSVSVDAELVSNEQPAFSAWAEFAVYRSEDPFDPHRGEALVAPAELLVPLP